MKDYSYPYKKHWTHIQHISEVRPGKLYILENHLSDSRYLIKVESIDQYGIDTYTIVDPYNLNRAPKGVNNFDYRMYRWQLKRHPMDPSLSASVMLWEAFKPDYICASCGDNSIPNRINAYEIRYGQKIGYSTNYVRCSKCNHLSRHDWERL